MNWISKHIKPVFQLLYPNLCDSCGVELVLNEHMVCIACWNDLPKTHFYLDSKNLLAQKFWGRVPLQHAISTYYFNKSSKVQELMHSLKYRGNTELGILLGNKMGESLLKSSWIQEIDMLVPVPLSEKKQSQRGYNQSAFLCQGISEITNLPVSQTSLVRIKNTKTQTKMNTAERFENVSNAFHVKELSHLENKHILLVDDVVTTGATLEVCADALLKVPNVKLSIITLAYAID